MIYKRIILSILIILFNIISIFNVSAVTKHELLYDGCGKSINALDYKLIEPTLVEKVVQLGEMLHIHFMNVSIVRQYNRFGNLLVKLRELYPKFQKNPKGDRKRNIVKVLDDIIVCKLPNIKKYIDNGSKLLADDGTYIENKQEEIDKIEQTQKDIENSKDKTGPVVNIVGPENIDVELGTYYKERGASVRDERDTLVKVVIGGDTVDVMKLGTYNVTYTATDNSGNTTTETKVVKVIDTIAPKLTMKGDVNIETGLGINFNDPGIDVFDAADKSAQYTVSGNVDINTIGVYTLTYSAKDASGNISKPLTRQVKVTCLASGQYGNGNTRYSGCNINDRIVCTGKNIGYIMAGCNLGASNSTTSGDYYQYINGSFINKTGNGSSSSNPCANGYSLLSSSNWQEIIDTGIDFISGLKMGKYGYLEVDYYELKGENPEITLYGEEGRPAIGDYLSSNGKTHLIISTTGPTISTMQSDFIDGANIRCSKGKSNLLE